MESTPQIKEDQSFCTKITSPVRNFTWRIAVYMQFDAVIEAQWSESITDGDRPDIQSLRRQIRQLTHASKCVGIWLLTLAQLYLLMSILTYEFLSISLFQNKGYTDQYVGELYEYTMSIEKMKLVHSIFLVGICALIFNIVRLNKVLSRKQYSQILLMTCFISLLYFVPCLYIAKITFAKQSQSQTGGQLFIDWCSLLFTTSEHNWYGVILSVFIHAQIYAGIFGLQMITMSTKQAINRVESLRDNGRSTYTALELNSILQQNTVLNDDPEL